MHGLEVMGQTRWPSGGTHEWENLNNMKIFWELVSNFSKEQNMKMFMYTALDEPWTTSISPSFPHSGWWKLTRNSEINKVTGYVEKIDVKDDSDNNRPNNKDSASERTGSNTSTNPWVYVGIAFAVFVVIFVATLIFLYLRVSKLQEKLDKDELNEFWNGISEETASGMQHNGENVAEAALMVPYDKSLDIPKDKLKIDKNVVLGSGQFGTVFQALLERDGEIEVALKMTKDKCPKTALKGLLSEIKILSYLGHHPNIVSIVGAYTVELENGIVYLATELCTMGSLEGYLRRRSGNSSEVAYINTSGETTAVYLNEEEIIPVQFQERIRWSHEIACGMEYLGTKHVVHADLATRNVLLTSNKTAKITDFGLSRRLYDYTNYVKQQQEPLPWRWMAIESLRKLEFSAKSDVWSYGVTLWEIFADGDLPYPGLSWNLDFVDSLKSGLRMQSPPHANPDIFQLMTSCWEEMAEDRPNFTDLKSSTGNLMGTS